MPYRTFASRSSRPNERFEQLSRGGGRKENSTSSSSSTLASASASRKRVNVVTFCPTPSPGSDCGADVQPPAKLRRTATNVTSAPSSCDSSRSSVSKRDSRAGSVQPPTSALMISPRFRRVCLRAPLKCLVYRNDAFLWFDLIRFSSWGRAVLVIYSALDIWN